MKQLSRFFTLLALAVVASIQAWAYDVPLPKAQPVVVGQETYIMNVATKLFLGQGEAWGTQAVANSSGLKYVIKNQRDDGAAIGTDDEGNEYFTLPNGQYWLYAPSITGAAGHCTDRWQDGTCGNEYRCSFTDQTDWDSRGIWQFAFVGENIFTMQVPQGLVDFAEFQNLYVEGEFAGIDPERASNAADPTYGLYSDVVYAEKPENCQFFCVSENDHDVYSVKLDLAKLVDAAATCDVDATAAKNLINNPNATVDEVKAEIESLQKRLEEADSWNFPKDITEGIIVNPNPYEGHMDGWTVLDGGGKPATSWGGDPQKIGDWWIGEFWNSAGYSMRQTITVPAGVYTLRLYAMTRDNMNAVFKAGENQMYIARFTSGQANNRTAANELFKAGKAQNDISWVQTEEGSLEISLTADESNGDHWLPWRNFALLDRGYNMKSFQKAASALAEGWEEEFIDEAGKPRNIFTQAYFDAIVAAVESIPTSTNTETALAIYKNVQKSLNDLRENVQLYRWLYLRTMNEETRENPADEPWGLREPFTSVWEEAEEMFIDEEFDKTNEYLRDLKERYIKSRQETIWNIGDEVERGGDVTIYIENPHFKNDEGTASSFDGWTVSSSSTFQNNAGSIPVIEQWNGSAEVGTIDVSQEVTIRKVGAYRLKTKGWYRSTTNIDTHAQDGYNTVNTFLYGASSEYRFHDIYEHPYTLEEKQQYFPKGNLYGPTDDNAGKTYNGPGEDVDDATYIKELIDNGFETVYPNNCTGANELFNNPNVNWYDMTCDFLGLGVDTPVKIGVRGRNIPGYAWLIWDDFELVFIGDDLADMQPIAQQAADAAKEEFPSWEEIEANKQKWDALQNYISILDKPENKEALVEAYKKIDSAREDLRSSIDAYAKLRKENDKLNDDIIKYSTTAKEDALNAADNLYQEVEDMLVNGTVADEDIDAVIERILAAKQALRFPNNMDKASDDNPVDCTALINNPKYFDEGATMTGWEYEGIHNVEAEYEEIGFAEGWGNTPESSTFDIHQTISNLYEGTYKVMVNGVFRQGGVDAERKMSQYEYAEKMGKLDMLGEKAKEDVQVYNGAGQFYGNGVSKPFHRWNYIVTDEWESVMDIFIETGSYTDGAWVEYTDSVTYGADAAETYYLPDNRLALYQLTMQGLYDNELYCDVASDGKLTIGACNQNATGYDWTTFSNWRLYYLGTNSSHKTNGISETEVGPKKIDAIYSIDGRRLNALQKGMNIVVVNGKAKKIMVK